MHDVESNYIKNPLVLLKQIHADRRPGSQFAASGMLIGARVNYIDQIWQSIYAPNSYRFLRFRPEIQSMRPFILLTILFVSVLSHPCWAQQFRIETQIYLNGEAEATSENTTLFAEGLVFDIQSKGSQTHEVAILDPQRRQIFLLDRFREVKLQLDEIHLIKMADSLRKQTATNKAAGFLVNDRFEENVDYDTGTATLTSPTIKYTVKGRRPSDVRILPQYNHFTDYFTRMKFSDPQAFPPFPRLRLNQTLSKLGWIPTEVIIDIGENMLFKKGLKAASKHTLVPNLSDNDLATVSRLKTQWLNFKAVSLDEYRGLGNRVAEKQTSEETK